MTTARTHRRNIGRGGAARPRVAPPKPDNFTPAIADVVAVDTAAEVEVGDEPFDPSTLDFDPADHNVDAVKGFVEANPEKVDAILELELEGKARNGLLSFLDNFNTATND